MCYLFDNKVQYFKVPKDVFHSCRRFSEGREIANVSKPVRSTNPLGRFLLPSSSPPPSAVSYTHTRVHHTGGRQTGRGEESVRSKGQQSTTKMRLLLLAPSLLLLLALSSAEAEEKKAAAKCRVEACGG